MEGLIRKVLADIAYRHNEKVLRKVLAVRDCSKTFRKMAKNLSEIQEKSSHIFENPSLRQDALLVDQAKQQLDETVDKLTHQIKIATVGTSTPGLTKSLLGLFASLWGYKESLKWKN